uniref:DUF4206 domain-containing protein n=1 Tax=Macrostomum lignano TaxID=282301 RepID=A0A1I8FBC1_9PLAT
SDFNCLSQVHQFSILAPFLRIIFVELTVYQDAWTSSAAVDYSLVFMDQGRTIDCHIAEVGVIRRRCRSCLDYSTGQPHLCVGCREDFIGLSSNDARQSDGWHVLKASHRSSPLSRRASFLVSIDRTPVLGFLASFRRRKT